MAQTTTLNFRIIGQTLERLDNTKIVEKAKNYVEAQFSFNEVWENTTKAILIEGSDLRYKAYLNEENKCLIPNRVVRHDGFTLAVVGEDSEKFITITTNELYIAVGKGIKSDEEMESIYEITSQSLDVNKNGGTCNLEIKDEEKFYYEMQENDFSNMQHESGNQWSLDLSETLENVITEFKKRIGVDWDRLGIPSPVPSMPKCVYTPTKKVISVGEEEITYYVFSAVDSYGDTSANFYYQNDSWHVIFATGNLIDNETLNIRLENKQDVLEAGSGIDIDNNNVISTKKYLHTTTLNCDGHFIGTIWINIVIDKKEAFTDYRDLLQYISDYRLSTGFKMYVDSMGTVFDVFTEFLYDKTDESQEIDFTGYGVDEDNLVQHVNDRVIQLDMVTMSAYTPQEIQ